MGGGGTCVLLFLMLLPTRHQNLLHDANIARTSRHNINRSGSLLLTGFSRYYVPTFFPNTSMDDDEITAEWDVTSDWTMKGSERAGSCVTKAWLILKFQNKVFWIPYHKRSTQMFLFPTIQLYARQTAREPKKTLFLRWDELGSLSQRAVSPTLNVPASH